MGEAATLGPRSCLVGGHMGLGQRPSGWGRAENVHLERANSKGILSELG